MFQISIKLKGSPAMISRLNQIGSEEHRRAQDAMEDGGDMIIAYSDTIIPLDTGALRASKANEEVQNSKTVIKRVIGYGAPKAELNPKSGVHPGAYAVEQHEFPYQHAEGRTWKYLEFAVYRRAKAFMDLLRQRLKL